MLAASLSCLFGLAAAQPPSAPDDDDPKPSTTPPDTAGAIAPVPVTPPPESRSAPPDTTKRRAPPFRVMLRSTVLPGWGQMYNGRPLKAAVVVAGEGFLVYKALDELSKENDAVDRLGELDPKDPNNADEIAQAQDDKEKHYNLKINYIWWATVVHLLQMADAYVDAHLRDFSADLGPLPGPGLARAASSRPDPGLAVALRVRF
ncbi:MAG TPA: DUF5683 domain-containing protein [Candidatus Eisenbacteria bacterium]|nr:DUF5683 domain-containing protein [Candidatus Eisenbacteria bacterium]